MYLVHTDMHLVHTDMYVYSTYNATLRAIGGVNSTKVLNYSKIYILVTGLCARVLHTTRVV